MLHNPGVINWFTLIVTWENPCTSNFDAYLGKSKTSTDSVTVRDMQLYYDGSLSGTGVKLLISIDNSNELYLLTNIVNEKSRGWKKTAKDPDTYSISINSL